MSGGMVTNCPNCGAVVHDCVCDYCGTVFPSEPISITGKDCLFVTVDDSDELMVMGFNVRKVEVDSNPTYFYADDCKYHVIDIEPDIVTVSGTMDGSPMMAHKLRRLRDLITERLGDF